jgi:hypothetical protein
MKLDNEPRVKGTQAACRAMTWLGPEAKLETVQAGDGSYQASRWPYLSRKRLVPASVVLHHSSAV